MTVFVLLTRNDMTNAWDEAGVIEAHNSNEAKRNGYLRLENRSQISAIVAVPVRSWRPTPVRTEVTERVVLGEEKPEA